MAPINTEQRKETPAPPRLSEIMQVLEEYAADLRAVMKELRRKLN
jgi:hypothetical protein